MRRMLVVGCVALVMGGSVALLAAPPLEKEVEAYVRAAAKLVESKGEAAFPELRKPGSAWCTGERYIFVFDEKGLELVSGAFPKLEGTNLWDYQDVPGRYLLRDEVALVKAKGSGWVDLSWPKPGETKARKVRSFIQGVKLGDRLVIVGSAIYLD
jgi:cytochrome c